MSADRPQRSRRLAAAALIVVALAVTGERLDLARSGGHLHLFPKYLKLADAAAAGEFPRQRLNDVSPGYLWFFYAVRTTGAGLDAIRSLQIVMAGLAALIAAAAVWRLAGA
ncbi:MAG TPA: hypothetical protein VNL91_02940, partial [Thermoanaerobaculia bacterium]|nr:hypothetical protein [Thermoanaerobaculia bacterium]